MSHLLLTKSPVETMSGPLLGPICIRRSPETEAAIAPPEQRPFAAGSHLLRHKRAAASLNPKNLQLRPPTGRQLLEGRLPLPSWGETRRKHETTLCLLRAFGTSPRFQSS